jgi:hypothetical protein
MFVTCAAGEVREYFVADVIAGQAGDRHGGRSASRALARPSAWAKRCRRDPHRRRPFQRRAMSVERRPVHHGVAGAAMPAGVPTAAVTEAGDVADQDLIRAECVPVWAARRRAGHPLAVGRLDQLAEHNQKGKPTA